jgi:SH3 domain-containing YSC84-like protein 1
LVRDNEGDWSLPQFITLTGGSLGWQAGIQATDVILVFTTRKGVEGLMHDKFTIGVDASASAGPVGRNAAAATDGSLKSEILSYSRSRGLFAGVAIDGSVLDIDNEAHAMFYGSQSSELPRQVPQSAVELRQYLVNLSSGAPTLAAPVSVAPSTGKPAATILPGDRLEALRQSLNQTSGQLQTILTPPWQKYLALPKQIAAPPVAGQALPVEELKSTLARFDRVAKSPEYPQLTARPEFQSTYHNLQVYVHELTAGTTPTLNLPPPPSVN